MQGQPLGNQMIVCVTGAAGQIAYSFIPQLLRGNVFPGCQIRLRMLDITPALKVLEGVAMEILDCSYEAAVSVEYSDEPEKMFKDADVIVFLGGFPRKPGMQRKDLLELNKKIFETQGKALSVAKPDVRCVVIANPANTNATILAHFSNIRKQNITCLSRLDHNRAIGQIAQKTNSKPKDIQGIYIFGNHSLTQYPCIMHIKVGGKPIKELVDEDWLKNTFIPKVQKRGGEILNIKGTSSVFSAANAVVDHLRDWYLGNNAIVSMGIRSDGSYDIPEGIWSSLPVKCTGNFQYQIVKEIELCEFCKGKIQITVDELQSQLKDASIA